MSEAVLPIRVLITLLVIGLISIVVGCSDDIPLGPNQPPTIDSLAATIVADTQIQLAPGLIESGQAVILSCEIDDPEDDPLTIAWSANSGAFNRTDTTCVIWTAPDSAVLAVLRLTVSDGTSTLTDSLVVEVQPVQPVPIQPTLTQPATDAVLDNGCANGADPIEWDFDWQPLPGADRYHLYVIGGNAIYPVVDNSNLTQTEYHMNRTGCYIVNGNRFDWTWKVRARVNGTWTEWSERTFDVEPLNTDCDTDTVLLKTPKPGWYMDNGCPDGSDGLNWMFRWVDTPGATRYHIHVAISGGEALVNDTAVVTPWFQYDDPDRYIPETNQITIHWRVRAFVGGEWSPWSETRSFRPEPPGLDCGGGPVELLLPVPGEVMDNGCYGGSDPEVWDFTWSEVTGATRYQLWVIGETAVFPVVSSPYITDTTYRRVSYGYIAPGNDDNWSWQVRALVNGTWTRWSDRRYFDVEPVNTDCGGK